MKMTVSVSVARPILCGTWMTITGWLMSYGLVAMQTADVVPVWWQLIGAGLLGWWYKDRSKLRSVEADKKKTEVQ